MTVKVMGLIPARMKSERFPGKMLADLNGKPLILRVIEQARKAKSLSGLAVLTDSNEIADIVQAENHEAIMTPESCPSGTERIVYAYDNKLVEGDAFINIQGDEPLIAPELIDSIAEQLKTQDIVTAVSYSKDIKEFQNENSVKAVMDHRGNALYFSRSPIPCFREKSDFTGFYKHIGIYGYSKDFLQNYHKTKESHLEKAEHLEQLRFLENGHDIKVIITPYKAMGVDTQEDLEKIIKTLKG